VISRRFFVFLPVLVVSFLAATWFWLLHTQSGARWIWAQVESATSNALSAADISGDISAGLLGRGIAYASDGVRVSIAEVSLSADVDLLPLRVTVLPAHVLDLRIELRGDKETDDESDLRETFANLQLPVELVFTDVVLERGAIERVGEDRGVVVDSVSLTGRWKDTWLVESFSLESPLVSAQGSGNFELFDDNELLLETDVALPGELTGLADTLRISTSAQGPLDGLVLQARTDEPRMHLRGRVSDITNTANWEAFLDVPSLDLPAHVEAPELPPLEITVEASGDAQTADVQAEVGFAHSDIRITIDANVDLSAATLSSQLDWQDAQWPVGDPEPRVSSRSGKVAVSGTLDDWTVAGTIELDVPELPPGVLTIDGGGDLDGASVRILDGDILGGTIAGDAAYSWRGSRPYTAQLELREIHTAAVLPDWPAVLSGKLELGGQQEPFQLSVLLADIAGPYGDRTLRADGGFDINDDRVSVDDLRIRHGETSVRVDGDPYSADGLRYQLHVDDFEYYLEDSFGSAEASGVLSLKPDAQFLRVDASSETFGWRDFRIANLAIVDRGEGILDAVVTADRLQSGSIDVGQLRLQAQLDKSRQRIDIETSSDRLRSALTIDGALDSWESPSLWSGQLTRLEIEHDAFATVLEEPSAIVLSKQSASIEKYCGIGRRGVELCMALSWDAATGLDMMATLASLPVDLVNAFVETGAHFDQVVSGGFRLQRRPDGALTGRADLAATPGRAISADDPEMFFDTGPARFGFDIDDDDLRGGVLDIPFPGLGQIEAEFEILDVADEGPGDISGFIDADLEDIGLLIALFPYVDSADGVLRADLDIGGSVDDPRVRGDFALEKGVLTYLPTGLKLDDIELRSELQENGEIELTGSFRAGDGRAEIRTRADHARTAARGLELTVRGENLTVIDVPDVRAVADADLRVNFDGQTLDLNGKIAIPHSRIRPANISATRVYESEDVIIVVGELPDEPADDRPAAEIDFAGSVVVELGNDVVVDLEVTEVRVKGSSEFTWSGDPMPNAIGRYDVDGEILVFGQRLEITEGFVRFENVRADDPYLRLRAEREIYGNTEVRRAGALVSGNLSRPTIEPYTTPVTTEERALTLLVTGSDFDIDQGVGAIDFGTYVAPRVFVSYGIGLFEEENVIRVRYDLKRGFGVTGSSGGREAGVDLSYRFEN
jgi:translocation and assembly module TamB